MCITVMLKHSRSRCQRHHHTEGLFDDISMATMQRLSQAANEAELRRQVIRRFGRYPGEKLVSDNDKSVDDDSGGNHAIPDPG